MDGEKYIDSLDMFSIRLGLERVSLLAEKAGHPEKSLKFIHLAGTNGKGSTGAMLECALRNMGYTTGFYSSPHLIDVRERFRVNGKCVSRQVFDREVENLAALCAGDRFTYFEFTTILAARIFKEANCDFVIWETGLGGRLDATNIVKPEAVIITNIAFDHQERLGNTLAAIAFEKAGIIKSGVPVFYGKLAPDAKEVIEKRAAELGCEVFSPKEDVPQKSEISETQSGFIQTFRYCSRDVSLSLGGMMQRENFRIVYNVLEYLSQKYSFDFDKSLSFLDRVIWPCRFQKVNSRVIVDGGHNPDGAAALVTAANEFCPGERFTVVFAAFEDKDVESTLQMLSSQVAQRFVFTKPAPWGRASHKFESLKRLVPQDMCCVWNDTADGALAEALKYEERVLVFGSLHLAGKVLEILCGSSEVCNLVI